MTYVNISLLLYAVLFALDLRLFIKKKDRKVLLIYLPIFIFTLTVNVLYGLGYHIPSPADPIKIFITSITGQ